LKGQTMKRLGAVIVFKADVDKDEAVALLEKIVDDLATYWEPKDLVHEFDDEMGGPVWYIP
tara:strand:+ start:351 stop:533 length:183 start_codon:yes stop_codon:yes gene_type:complete